jgi:hypothetical protein
MGDPRETPRPGEEDDPNLGQKEAEHEKAEKEEEEDEDDDQRQDDMPEPMSGGSEQQPQRPSAD